MALFGFLLYAGVVLVCIVFIVVPLSVALAAAGIGTGTAAALCGVAFVLAGGSGVGVLTPTGVRHGLPGRVATEFVRRDRAWPQYFAAQAGLDARLAAVRVLRWTRRMWKDATDWLIANNAGGFWWPIVLVPTVVVVAATSLGLGLGLAAGLLAIAVVTLVAWLVGVPVVYLLRTVDAGWRTVFSARASCINCFEVAAVPAYRCRGPHGAQETADGDDLHRDLRPGRLGVLWRRCSCGWRLPTMVLRAAFSRRLVACCPSCGTEYFPRAGVVRDVRAPVFGAASAGKTQFIMSAMVGLHRAAERAGITLKVPDEGHRRTYSVFEDLTARGAPAPKTDTTAPVAVTVRVEQGVNSTLLHLFDAAGETLTDPEQNATLSYLDNAETLTFVLDPFSVERVQHEYRAASEDVFTEASAALYDPEASYNATAQRLQGYGVRTAGRRLAFVVTKADLLRRLPLRMPAPDSAAVRGWLCEQGLENLVVAAERDFKETRYFLVSGRDTGPDGPVAVLRWILKRGWGNIG
ncbi:TRAFAC clade GTPase domain-containing protein [Catenuloplanes nepalensis]|nr:hypothetical protein [Catenuloplanes nepalensis]